jgi:hypothetical protein
MKGRRVHCCPQRARTPGPRGPFPCKTAVFGGPPEGTMIAIVEPQATATVMVGEGRTPVEVVPVVRVKTETSRWLPPKDTDPRGPAAFSLQTGPFQATARRDHDRHRGPQASRRRGGGRRRLPPLWQYRSSFGLRVVREPWLPYLRSEQLEHQRATSARAPRPQPSAQATTSAPSASVPITAR